MNEFKVDWTERKKNAKDKTMNLVANGTSLMELVPVRIFPLVPKFHLGMHALLKFHFRGLSAFLGGYRHKRLAPRKGSATLRAIAFFRSVWARVGVNVDAASCRIKAAGSRFYVFPIPGIGDCAGMAHGGCITKRIRTVTPLGALTQYNQ